MTAPEYWVMRIVCRVPGKGGPPLTKRVARELALGHYQAVNGDVVEPIVDFDDQEMAMIRAQVETAKTGAPHKVVMNAELPT